MQIMNIKNTIGYKSSTTNPQMTSNAQNVDNYKKDFLQKIYDQQYKKDLKNYNIGSVFGSIFCLFVIIAEMAKNNKKGATIAGITLAACSPLYFIFKPKKEKYATQIQIDLNKEAAYENSTNK